MAYSQNDPAWKSKALGFDSSNPADPNYGTLGMYGCYVTAIAEVSRWGGRDVNPDQVNELAKQNGWFVRSDLIARDDIPALLCGDIQYQGRTNWNTATPMEFFADASDPNVAYIICIDSSHAPGIQTHFIMVWGTLNNGDLEVEDSWDGRRKNLSSYGNPSAIIQSAMKFTKSAPKPAIPFQIVETYASGRKVTVKAGSHKWGMLYPDFDSMNANPILTVEKDIVIVAVERLRHNNGYEYFREANNIDAFNVLDCVDYVEPVYVPPAAPVKGTIAERYEILTNLAAYSSLDELIKGKNPSEVVRPGMYYVWDKKGDNTIYRCLSTDNMKNDNLWINTIGNKKPLSIPGAPKPVETSNEWKSTRVWFYPESKRSKFDMYELQRDVLMKDLDGKGKDYLLFAAKPGQSDNAVLKVYGTFYKNGMKYYLLHLPADVDWLSWYGIPALDTTTGKPYLLKYAEVYDPTPKPHELTLSELALEGFARIGFKVMDVVRSLRIKHKG